MQIVIEIHEKDYQSALKGNISFAVLDAIQKATVLPEHGRLIDSDNMIADLKHQCETVFRLDAVKPEDYYIAKDAKFMQATWKTWCEDFCKWANNRPTILEATKGANE